MLKPFWLVLFTSVTLVTGWSPQHAIADQHKKIVFVAGTRSHGYGSHEHYAGSVLLAKSLQQASSTLEVEVVRDGWPQDESVFEDVDCVVMYADGGQRHPVLPHLETVDKLADAGVGIVCIHYGVEVPKGEAGQQFLKWIGGYFETDWSVNPHWNGEFTSLPEHPITRGVEPFEAHDEWYYHMRFREGMEGVTPILSDLPPDSSLRRRDGHHSNNPHVRAAVLQRREPQHVAWAAERPGGGRGFGFTGGHNHWNWGNENLRKLVLNAIVWCAQGEVPAGGMGDVAVTLEDLEANQDYDPPENFDREKTRLQFKLTSKEDAATAVHQAEAAVDQLVVHPELEVRLFASEPMMFSPTNIDIDHMGRVWVCEVVNYRRFRNAEVITERAEGDRILILEDTDRDGQADKSTTFYQGRDIDSVHGICVLPTPSGQGTRAIVSAQDQVFYLHDDDGDLRADRKELLFTGISGVEHDHGIHAFIFGPDGKLYFNFGNEGKQICDRNGDPIVDLAGNTVNAERNPYQQGMVFRCNLDGSEFETLAWNFRNNWELAVDSFGTLWQSDNDDDGNRSTRINYVMEFGNYGYRDERTGATWKAERTGMHDEIPLRHWHLRDPGVVPNLLQTGAGSPTGICLYEGLALPKVFRGQMIHCDAGPNIVRAYPVRRDGAGYSAKVVNILDGQANPWFRPSDVCVAPDGSLIVADWYDPGVGGHKMGDGERGRLFRVTARGKADAYEVAANNFRTIRGATRALRSPNLATRYMAYQAIRGKGLQAEAALNRIVANSKRHRIRARALWLLAGLPDKGEDVVKRALEDKNVNIRIQGVRMARQLKLDIPTFAAGLVNDPSPQVRRELAVALRHNRSPEAAALWAELAAQYRGDDRWYLEALGIAADQQWDTFLQAWLERIDHQWRTDAGRDLIWRSRAKQTPDYLAQIIVDSETPSDTLPRYFRAFDFLSGPEKDQALEKILLAE